MCSVHSVSTPPTSPSPALPSPHSCLWGSFGDRTSLAQRELPPICLPRSDTVSTVMSPVLALPSSADSYKHLPFAAPRDSGLNQPNLPPNLFFPRSPRLLNDTSLPPVAQDKIQVTLESSLSHTPPLIHRWLPLVLLSEHTRI